MEQHAIKDREVVAKLMSGRTGQMKSYVAILLVSVGKENFERKAIKAAIKMINQEFKGCCIVVADALQRFNFATIKDITDEQAYHQSLAEGDAWLERYNSYFIAMFSIPYEILRWDSLITDSDFEQKEKKFSLCIQKYPLLAQAMEKSIEEYGCRLRKRLSNAYFNEIFQQHKKNCFSYLKEECVALTLLPKNIKLTQNKTTPLVIVYPGKSTSVLTENYEFFIKNEFQEIVERHNDFLNWIPYRFNKIKHYDLLSSVI